MIFAFPADLRFWLDRSASKGREMVESLWEDGLISYMQLKFRDISDFWTRKIFWQADEGGVSDDVSPSLGWIRHGH